MNRSDAPARLLVDVLGSASWLMLIHTDPHSRPSAPYPLRSPALSDWIVASGTGDRLGRAIPPPSQFSTIVSRNLTVVLFGASTMANELLWEGPKGANNENKDKSEGRYARHLWIPVNEGQRFFRQRGL